MIAVAGKSICNHPAKVGELKNTRVKCYVLSVKWETGASSATHSAGGTMIYSGSANHFHFLPREYFSIKNVFVEYRILKKRSNAMKKVVIAVLCFVVLYGCASSRFTSNPEGARTHIGKTDISGQAPVEGRVPRTTFGKYPVKISKEGSETLYGILPLHVSPAAIGLDALFLAPLAFANVQGPFPYYEFDLQRNVIKYKDSAEDNWLDTKSPMRKENGPEKFYGE